MTDRILEPVYFISPTSSDIARLLIALEVDDSYGLASIKVVTPKHTEKRDDLYPCQLKRFHGNLVAEITKEIVIFKGRLITPAIWRPSVVICDKSRVIQIKEWVESLNKNTHRN